MSDQQLTNCWENNSDGAGILYKEDGVLKVYKQLASLELFRSEYRRCIALSNCLVHFRVQSAGNISMENIHPFMVHEKLGMIHNGTITKLKIHGDDRSDTQIFVSEMLSELPPDFVNNYTIMELIEEYVGWSRLVFMDETEVFTIVNEGKNGGHYDGGNWFSNDSHKKINDFVYRGSERVSKTTSTTVPKLTKLSYPKEETQHAYTDPYDEWWKEQEETDLQLTNRFERVVDEADISETHPMEDTWDDYMDDVCAILDQVPPETLTSGKVAEIGSCIILSQRVDVDLVFYTTVATELKEINKLYEYTCTIDGALSFYTVGD
jgi:hypothetical protein